MTDPTHNLEIYLVGGAVRDQLLGLEVKDRDWVVVGATPEEMIKRGFKSVGKDFPVFLHPGTGEEYALARSERKTARGYHGFEFVSDPTITLEQDLKRRDLTINAVARDPAGKIIDPWGGVVDLRQRRIRHVSRAFSEDPVRVLRVARFAARYKNRGFTVDRETVALMQEMVDQGEVDALTPERVWQETEQALKQKNCATFFEELRRCRALKGIMPEVDALFGVPQTAKYHPEIDTGKHILLSLEAAQKITGNPLILFAVLVHDLGKALTPKAELPAHRKHEERGIEPVNRLCDRLRVPKKYRLLALKVCQNHLLCHRIATLRASTILKLLERLDGFRNPDVVSQFTVCCTADMRGRTGFETVEYEQAELVEECYLAAQSVDTGNIAAQYTDGNKIRNAIRQQRVRAIKQAKTEYLARRRPRVDAG